MSEPIVPVILSGGSGTRLWPVSRRLEPKQFTALVSERTMFQETAGRTAGIAGDPIVVCSEAHGGIVRRQLAEVGRAATAVLLEPAGRNTAAATAAAALRAAEGGADPLLLVLPADHVIRDTTAFHEAVAVGAGLAAGGRLVTFGIVPDRAHTGYGYIRRGVPLAEGGYAVDRFVEKPDAVTAEGYLADGGYLWNSGMFLFRASRYLDELGRFAPGILMGTRRALEASRPTADGLLLDEAAFAATPADSIDYAVMEHTTGGAVVPLDAGWSDVGAWPALWEIAAHDDAGNAALGDVVLEGAEGAYVRSESRLVAVVGLDDVVVIETPDAVLVTSRQRAEEVKAVVERLRAAGRPEAERPADG